MRFFDCNTFIGVPTNAPLYRPESAATLLAAMDRAGIERALIWHVAQHECDPLTGNELLARAIAPHERLFGCWTILPTQCGELGGLDAWLAAAKQARVRAFRAFPGINRYLLRREAVGDVLDALSERRLPLLLSLPKSLGGAWAALYDLLRDFPELTLVICDPDVWPADRFFRPLIERYERVHLEISTYFADGGIEAFVGKYGPERLLFGTGYPASYHGSAMLAVAHAEIRDADKALIAGGNLERLLAEAEA